MTFVFLENETSYFYWDNIVNKIMQMEFMLLLLFFYLFLFWGGFKGNSLR